MLILYLHLLVNIDSYDLACIEDMKDASVREGYLRTARQMQIHRPSRSVEASDIVDDCAQGLIEVGRLNHNDVSMSSLVIEWYTGWWLSRQNREAGLQTRYICRAFDIRFLARATIRH